MDTYLVMFSNLHWRGLHTTRTVEVGGILCWTWCYYEDWESRGEEHSAKCPFLTWVLCPFIRNRRKDVCWRSKILNRKAWTQWAALKRVREIKCFQAAAAYAREGTVFVSLFNCAAESRVWFLFFYFMFAYRYLRIWTLVNCRDMAYLLFYEGIYTHRAQLY